MCEAMSLVMAMHSDVDASSYARIHMSRNSWDGICASIGAAYRTSAHLLPFVSR